MENKTPLSKNQIMLIKSLIVPYIIENLIFSLKFSQTELQRLMNISATQEKNSDPDKQPKQFRENNFFLCNVLFFICF